MSNSIMMINILISFLITAEAHVVGSEPWCFQFSKIHFECIFKTEKDCFNNLKIYKKPISFFKIEEEPYWDKPLCVVNPNPDLNEDKLYNSNNPTLPF